MSGEEATSELQAGCAVPENRVAAGKVGDVVRFWIFLKIDLVEFAGGWMGCGRRETGV